METNLQKIHFKIVEFFPLRGVSSANFQKCQQIKYSPTTLLANETWKTLFEQNNLDLCCYEINSKVTKSNSEPTFVLLNPNFYKIMIL